MKTKSLFISTIAMVVLLVVALATGTFAWYASQQSVNATGATLGAVISEDAAIELGWEDTNYSSLLQFGSADLRPMIPVSVPEGGTEAATFLLFNEAVLATGPDGLYVASVDDTSEPWTQRGTVTEPVQDDLYVRNMDQATTVYIFPTVSFVDSNGEDPDLLGLLRVAVFFETATEGTFKFMGVWGTNNMYAYDITVDDTPAEIAHADNLISPPTKIAPASESTQYVSLAGGEKQKIVIQAWLEGTTLDTTTMNYADSVFNLKVRATQTNPAG